MRAAATGRYLDALGTADPAAALAVAEEQLARAGGPEQPGAVVGVLVDVVCAAQHEVGVRWLAGRWNVAQEHAATAISERVVATLADRLPVGRRGRVVVACADREWHALPARVVDAALRSAGVRTTYLGAALPPLQLARYLHDTGPDALALSCSLAGSMLGARRTIEAAREAGVPVLLGGAALDHEGVRAARLGAHAYAPDARSAADVLATMPRTATPVAPLDHPGADEAAEIGLRRSVVGAAVRDRVDLSIGPGAVGAEWREALDGLVPQVVDAVAAALLIEDPTVLDEARDWAGMVLLHRGAGGEELAVVGRALTDELRELPEASRLLRHHWAA
ncbi:MAG TPA: cobalamin-dependent protein [Jiangellales bacterium]|nr:cobalamin-dependent protein [Jiangellales bacterium]